MEGVITSYLLGWLLARVPFAPEWELCGSEPEAGLGSRQPSAGTGGLSS